MQLLFNIVTFTSLQQLIHWDRNPQKLSHAVTSYPSATGRGERILVTQQSVLAPAYNNLKFLDDENERPFRSTNNAD